MNNIESKILIETLKPANGFIHALLDSKIKKVKLWVSEKELEGQVDKEKLPLIMEEYLVSLAHQVSEVTSIAFPLHKLKIDEVYEPLELEESNIYSNSKGKINIIDTIKNIGGAYIIIDGAGMGKSTFSKYIITQLLFKCERIPIFFELRKVKSNLLQSISKELDFPGDEFSGELFYKLIKLGKFILILDGYDEIDNKYIKSCSKQIRELSIKGRDNTIVLTSRPQDSLPDLLNVKSFTFCKFTTKQAASLIKRYDKISASTFGEKLIEEFSKIPSKFIESPLLVSLLYRTYGFNKTIANKISAFYDEMYNALYKGHDLINKNCYTREKISKLDFEDFRRLIRALCYCMSINKKVSFENQAQAINYIDKACNLISISPKSSMNFFNDLLLSVPLIVKDGTEYKFIHKTIIEYFTAEYLINNSNSKDLLLKIFRSEIVGNFKVSFDFIYEMNPSLYNHIVTKKFATEINELEIDIIKKNLNIFRSLVFYRESAVIGFWEKSKYSDKTHNSQDMLSVRVFSAENMLLKFSSGSWVTVSINGVEYYCGIAIGAINKGLFKDAWHLLTECFEYDHEYNHNKCYAIEGMVESLEKNTWHKLELSMISNISKYNIICKPAASMLMHGHTSNERAQLRVISHAKSLNILEKLEAENRQEIEINQLLE